MYGEHNCSNTLEMELCRCISLFHFIFLVVVDSARIIKSTDIAGFGMIKNVSFSSVNTICLKIKTYQFYQFFHSEKNNIESNGCTLVSKSNQRFLGPHQTIASIGDISMMTVPSLPCDQISYTCTAQVEAILGNKWKHGKTFAGIYGVNFYPSWTPNTWNSICIVLTSTKTKVYINNEIADEVSLNTFYELSLNTYVDIRKVK